MQTINLTPLPLPLFLYFYPDESKDNVSQFAYIPVHRLFGRFGTVTVQWSIMEGNSTDDLDPVEGTLTFNPGEGEKFIEILTKEDEVILL